MIANAVTTGNSKSAVEDFCRKHKLHIKRMKRDGNCGLHCFTQKSTRYTPTYLRTMLRDAIVGKKCEMPVSITDRVDRGEYAKTVMLSSYYIHWEEMDYLATALKLKLVIISYFTEQPPVDYQEKSSLWVSYYNNHYDYVVPLSVAMGNPSAFDLNLAAAVTETEETVTEGQTTPLVTEAEKTGHEAETESPPPPPPSPQPLQQQHQILVPNENTPEHVLVLDMQQ